MRTQYHFRPSERGLLAWDVHRLIAHTQALDLQPFAHPIGAVAELDEPYWFADTGGVPTCRAVAHHASLIAEADARWPIILCPAGRVMDGMHRVVKALMAGQPTVLAVQLRQLPEPDFCGVAPDDLPYGESA